MTIKRNIDGKEIEIELTHDELFEAFECYEHHCDCEYVRNTLNSGSYEEFENLTDEAWEKAVKTIAHKKRSEQDDNHLDETDALDTAIGWYIKNHLNHQMDAA